MDRAGVTDSEDAPTEPPFPPKLIRKWLNGGTVSTLGLAAEFRMWCDYFEGKR